MKTKLMTLCLLVLTLVMPAAIPAATPPHRHALHRPHGREIITQLQRETTAYIWDKGHPTSGFAYEASFAFPQEGRPLAVGGTGFGVAAIVAGVERGWIPRPEAARRILQISRFARDDTARRLLHGALPHWLHVDTGQPYIFADRDDGADLVETSLLLQGLLIARAYFDQDIPEEKQLRDTITTVWEEVDWNWFTNGKDDGLYWHWSPNHDFKLGLKITGFNECLIAYILALASPTHPIHPDNYRHWTSGEGFGEKKVAGYRLPAALPGGGPLFICHYSFVGLDPMHLSDSHVPQGYFVRNVIQVLSNRGYCLYEASREAGYDESFWGLTSCLVPAGYAAQDPVHDEQTVAPTAALASFPYTPFYSQQVLERLNGTLRRMAWGENGPYDAINLAANWCAREYLAIDQLPIPCMIENYRSGLLWKLFMNIPEIANGLAKAGLVPPDLATGFPEVVLPLEPGAGAGGYRESPVDLLPHPDYDAYRLPYWSKQAGEIAFALYDAAGERVWQTTAQAVAGRNWLEFTPEGEEGLVRDSATDYLEGDFTDAPEGEGDSGMMGRDVTDAMRDPGEEGMRGGPLDGSWETRFDHGVEGDRYVPDRDGSLPPDERPGHERRRHDERYRPRSPEAEVETLPREEERNEERPEDSGLGLGGSSGGHSRQDSGEEMILVMRAGNDEFKLPLRLH